MIKTKTLLAVSAALFASTSAYANDYSASVGISTLGLTISPEYRYSEELGMRALIGYGTISRSFEEEGTNVDATVTTGGAGVLLDYYPTDYGIRLTAGAIAPLYSIEASSSGATTEFDGVEYGVSDLEAKVGTSGVAGYLGLGYVYDYGNGWNMSMDLGAIVGLSYSSDYSYTSTNLPADEKAQFEAEVNEAVDEIMESLDEIGGVLPYFSLSVGYHF